MNPRARHKVLILGGTSEANALAAELARAPDIDAMLSYAGRTDAPKPPPIAWRVGGFGGAQALADFIREHDFDRLVDATHPFAAQMSANAIIAAERAGIPLIAFERDQWIAQPGDNWLHVADISAAAAALPVEPLRIFLAIGRLHLAHFAAHPQHHYVVRLIDAPREPLPLPHVTTLIARGPFDAEGDTALMRDHRIDVLVAKNAGGAASYAKIIATRRLGIRTIMIERPFIPPRATLNSVDAVMRSLGIDEAA